MRPIDIPPLVADVAREVARDGGHAYLVGGGVRDHLMGQAVKDWDIEVFGLDVDRLEAALRRVGRVNAVGRAFAVLKLRRGPLELDVSIPRRDSKVGAGHRGILAAGDPSMTPQEAAQRRDLTVNALMVDLNDGALLDPAGGLSDVVARVLRPVDDATFLEDPLRALRAVQFAARLDFAPSPSLVALCREARLDELPAERVLLELTKLLLKGVRPSRGLQLARDADLLRRVVPTIAPHLDAASDRRLDAFAAVRPDVHPDGRALALGVATWWRWVPLPDVEAALDRLALHRHDGFPTRKVLLDVLAHAEDPWDTDAALRWLSTRAELETSLRMRALVEPARAVEAHEALARARLHGWLHDKPPALFQGRDAKQLGVSPGPAMGALLAQVYAAQLDGRVETATQALEEARRLLAARGTA